ncbi:pyridoxamine 5'-phosphate oxidase family protein [Eubacteriales bacterium OttesenSCG-928-M02]|nr:pyridoxamine 5'-phosphate oxidase family protein [Eubacteriales bacterium OttesenSCG-928-M02]
MFREMRRKAQQLDDNQAETILQNSTAGVLAVWGDDDYPYAVPLSYAYENNTIYFHCAMDGHKTDAIKRHPKVSFCVIGQDDVIPQSFTTHFQSVIAFGNAEILTNGGEIQHGMDLLFQKYSPEEPTERRQEEMASSQGRLCVVAIRVAHLTGKEAVELMRQRKGD